VNDPFKITGPALVSFSGGRTSGYMLHRILQAHGGTLPGDVVVVFANTGKEREETLRFVHECSTRWGVPIRWVEWRAGSPGFEQVGFNSASRDGEPFAALIASKQILPNWQARWCTGFLKVAPMHAMARQALGVEAGGFTSVIGLRHDEGLRVLKGMERAERDGDRVAYPLAKAKVVKADVMAFWREQPFDLGLQPWEGNCDLCFLKGREIKKRIIREDPARADWWIEQEDRWGFFSTRDRVRGLRDEVRRMPELFDAPDDEHDVECGLYCGAGDETDGEEPRNV
jgi:hypothetical protein